MIKNKTDLTLITIILFLLLALGASLFLVRQRQVVQKQAAGNTVTVSLAPNSGNYSINGTFTTKIWLNTGTTKISAAKVVINFDKTRLQVNGAIQRTVGNGLNNVIDITEPATANSTGQIKVILTVKYDEQGLAPTGAIDYANIPFKAISEGTAQVSFVKNLMQIVQFDDEQDMVISDTGATYTVGGGSTPTPTPTGGVTGTPTPTLTPTVTPTPTGGITPTPTGAPSISRISNYCGKPLETILTIYGTDFGATQGESKVYFSYKASSVAANSTYKEVDANIISWTNTTVFAKVPEVDFGSNNTVVSKVKLVKQGYTGYPANFPPGEVAFFSISKDATRNIGDLDCNNAVNFADFAILFNNWDK